MSRDKTTLFQEARREETFSSRVAMAREGVSSRSDGRRGYELRIPSLEQEVGAGLVGITGRP